MVTNTEKLGKRNIQNSYGEELYFILFPADRMTMDISAIMPIVKIILHNKYVIGTAIVVFLYMDFACYVANYRKKPPKQRKPHVVHSAPKQEAGETAASDGSETTDANNSSADNTSSVSSAAKRAK
jgi:hypothetical protein